MDPLPLLCRLVEADSVNPSLVPGAAGEAEAAEVARKALAEAGLDASLQEVAPGRPNAIGVLEGRAPGPTVMLCGHLDTVGVEGMSNPFTPRVEHGRVYGRGTQDMKGGVAAMIAAAAVLRESWTRGRLVVACVADEEHMSLGAEAVAREWTGDAAIVTEPTDLTMAIGHKGFVWLSIETRGRAAHGSRPAEGRDAIAHMGRVLVALEALDRDLQSRPPAPYQGTASLHASIIRGGRELSVYPDHCVVDIERRTVAGESEETARTEIESILTRLHGEDAAFDGRVRIQAGRPPHCLDAAHPLAQAVSAALERSGRSGAPGGMSFWTDAAILSASGTPSLLFGPGGAGLHSVEEYVNVDDLYVCRDVIVDSVRTFVAGVAPRV
jgi:acetylornithine deacetylase